MYAKAIIAAITGNLFRISQFYTIPVTNPNISKKFWDENDGTKRDFIYFHKFLNFYDDLLLEETNFVCPKYLSCTILRRQMVNVFGRKLYSWIFDLFKTSISLKDVFIDHRKIIFLIDTEER